MSDDNTQSPNKVEDPSAKPQVLVGDGSILPIETPVESTAREIVPDASASEVVEAIDFAIEPNLEPTLSEPDKTALESQPSEEIQTTSATISAEESALTESRTPLEPAPESSPSLELLAPEAVQQEVKIIERMREPTEEEKDQIFRNKLKSLSPKGVSTRKEKQIANHEKILTHLRTHGYITNDEVEKLCKVKDNTAYKYLTELEKQGLIMQLGKTGRNTRYRLTQATP